MKKNLLITVTVCALSALLFHSSACTSLMVTKGASKDGSTMVTYTCDGPFHPHFQSAPAQDYKKGDSVTLYDWRDNVIGKIPQVEHTYGYVGFINEYQLAIGETTSEGRSELENPQGLMEYWDMMTIALQRAKTAREAIAVMTGLVEVHGYRSSGETFSIADKKEVWIMEMIGPGPGGKGALWVALKVPDGYISCHANKARIGAFPLNDPNNCLYAKNVISFAVEKGYYDPKSGKPFLFNEAYCPSNPKNKRYADGRVWSILRRAAPSQKFSSDYHRAVDGAKPYPLWIKPDKKLSVADVFSLMRDHYEGTDYDMTKGIDAGPYGTPSRSRPVTWNVDSIEYGWERSISTPQTGFSFVSQSRSHLPDAVGGVLWYGLDDTYMTCYTPLYCSISAIPKSFTVGDYQKFSWESAFWVFNFTSNIANLKYSYMLPEIQAVQKEIEGNYLALQPAVEKTALELLATNPALAKAYLTDYSVSHAESMVEKWRNLGQSLFVKYVDGFVKDENGRPKEKGYPEAWLKDVLKLRPEQFLLKKQ